MSEVAIVELRTKILEGYEPTVEEVREALEFLRVRRAGSVKPKKTSTAKKAPRDLSAILGMEIGGDKTVTSTTSIDPSKPKVDSEADSLLKLLS